MNAPLLSPFIFAIPLVPHKKAKSAARKSCTTPTTLGSKMIQAEKYQLIYCSKATAIFCSSQSSFSFSSNLER